MILNFLVTINKRCLFIVLHFFILFVLSSCSSKELGTDVVIQGYTMGTRYMVKLPQAAGFTQARIAQLKKEINILLVDIDKKMSTWIQDSELSRFNASPVGHWFKLSSDTFTVIKAGIEVYHLSAGKFDITVGPLIVLWGFNSNELQKKIPDKNRIKQALAEVGSKALVLDSDKMRIKKLKPRTVNLSAIAKGYAVDQLAAYLQKKKFSNYLVEIGGEIKVRGKRLVAKNQESELVATNNLCHYWRIAIESPLTNQRRVFQIIAIKDEAVATSGDYRNYFELNGKRYSHTINPSNGYPITHKLASVTVIHKSAMMADALATAIFVMGPKQGKAFAQANGIAAYFISKNQHGFSHDYSQAFQIQQRKVPSNCQ